MEVLIIGIVTAINIIIIKMKFGIECEEMKTSEIAKKLGLTVQSVNSTIKNSINIMKQN
jgi:predicted transcriptional regulator